MKHYGIRIATFYTVCIFYAFINYSTGNTAFSYPSRRWFCGLS